jgi:large subunit ribosomal protein L18
MARSTRELRQRRHARIRRRLSGTAERPRVAVSRTNKHISAQIMDTSGGNIDGAKAVAQLLAQRAKDANITTVVFDRGGFDYHGRVAAFADTLRAAGLEF